MVSLRALYSIPGCRGLPRAATRKSEFMSANANVQLYGTQCFTVMDNVLKTHNLIIMESVLQIHNLIVLDKVGILKIHNLIIMDSAFYHNKQCPVNTQMDSVLSVKRIHNFLLQCKGLSSVAFLKQSKILGIICILQYE